MSSLTKLMVSPHIHSGRSTSSIMRDVLISLLPITVAGTVIFGLRALLVIAVCVLFCVGFEAIFNLITKKPIIYMANVSENDILNGNEYVDIVKDYASKENCSQIDIKTNRVDVI